MKLTKDRSFLQDFRNTISCEWLETNGIGGYASATLSGCNTRRYHGMLVAATNPPTERMVMVSKLDETIVLNDERIELGCNDYGDVVSPNGYQYLENFTKDLFPEWTFIAGSIILKKTVGMIHGENSTIILYEVIEADKEFVFEILPLFAARSYHNLSTLNDGINPKSSFDDGIFNVTIYENTPEIFICFPNSVFIQRPLWYNHLNYQQEKERGFDFREDLFSYGTFQIPLQKGQTIAILISTESPSAKSIPTLFHKEKSRRQSIVKGKKSNPVVKLLKLAADQFIVRRGTNLKTVIAGYHWFTDWSRDTMIAMNGLCLATGRLNDAKKILAAFAESESEGMLPNRFMEHGTEAEYNNADGTLWYFIAVHNYLVEGGDKKFILEKILPVLKNIIEWHYKGTRYNIHVDEDGLLSAGEPGVQLTWMDAKVGDWVVTPRIGKPVEINALWYNTLRIYAELLKMNGNKKEAKLFRANARSVKIRFIELFWNDALHYLYDVINGNDKDDSLRPNQLFALGLPFPLIKGKNAISILKVVREKLYTPVGLRSLSVDHPDYKGHYGGDAFHRDGAYHQGTVWSWLLGIYVDAIMFAGTRAAKKEVTEVIENFKFHLNEAGIGTVSEIFDGDAPHFPNGCIAQAWSVGELLRIIVKYEL